VRWALWVALNVAEFVILANLIGAIITHWK
jgi:hypothetical protein